MSEEVVGVCPYCPARFKARTSIEAYRSMRAHVLQDHPDELERDNS